MFLNYRISSLSKNKRLSEKDFLVELTKILDKNKCEYKRHNLMPMKSIYIIVKKETQVYVGIIIAGFIYGCIDYYGIETFNVKGE